MPSTLARKLKKLPTGPGVYLLKNKTGEIIYIGKAGNLKNRIKSYFQKGTQFFNAAKQKMIGAVADVETLETESEIAALIKESELIKKRKPKFNVLMRDSKNYLYVGFTKEEFPKIVLTHQPRLLKKFEARKPKSETPKQMLRIATGQANPKSQTTNYKLSTINYTGPFTDAGALRKSLRFLRDIFPYCTCKRKHAVKCLNAHLGKCLAVCCLKASADPSGRLKQQYTRNIGAIRAILRGTSTRTLRDLKKAIATAIKNQNYEEAQELKTQISNLGKVLSHAEVLSPEPVTAPPIFKDTAPHFQLLGLAKPPQRIETYDISNIQGGEAVGSMVVFEPRPDGSYRPSKSQYRKFKIKTVAGINDPAMMAEVIKRRLNHGWPLPQLVIVDGGRSQLNAALKALGGRKIRVIALAKRQEEIYLPERRQPVRADLLGQNTKHLLQAVRDEAHRFAVKYHRQLHRRVTLTPPRQGGAGLDGN